MISDEDLGAMKERLNFAYDYSVNGVFMADMERLIAAYEALKERLDGLE